MTMVANPVFIDTNILVYANISTAPFHQEALNALDDLVQGGAELWISRQILREYASTVTRPGNFVNPQPALTVVTRLQYFEANFRIAEDGAPVTQRWLDLLQTVPMGGKQVHDANIVATMQVYGITHLLTHNVGDFNRFAGLITVVPLVPPAPHP